MKTAAVTVTYQHLPPPSLSLSLFLCEMAGDPLEMAAARRRFKRRRNETLNSAASLVWLGIFYEDWIFSGCAQADNARRTLPAPFSFLFRPAPFEKQFRRHSRGQTARLSGRRVRPGKTQRESEGVSPLARCNARYNYGERKQPLRTPVCFSKGSGGSLETRRDANAAEAIVFDPDRFVIPS